MWLHIEMRAGSNRTVHADTYREFPDECYGSYKEEDFKDTVEDICDKDYDGWSFARGYDYSWEIVPKPSNEWLSKEIEKKENTIKKNLKDIDNYKNLMI